MNDRASIVYCFDFDGVLCDSVDECLTIAFSTYYRKEISNPNEIPTAIASFFRQKRHLVAPANDYYLLFEAFERGILDLDRESFNALKSSTVEERVLFGNRFFEYRAKLQNNLDRWLTLNRFYPQVEKILREDFPEFYVVTTKDRDSVNHIAKHHRYIHKIAGVYSKELSTDKRQLFTMLFADLQISPSSHRIVFIDDNWEHLANVAPLDIDVYWAAWGYVDIQERGNYTVIQHLDDLQVFRGIA
jgi:phosphoglycolate phosphatase-like HAD superfamily hydrolase